MKKIVIIGATSAIAIEIALRYAGHNEKLFLVGRDPEKLATVISDLKVKGAEHIFSMVLDANEVERHKDIIERAVQEMGGIDIVIIAHGVLGDQAADENDYERIRQVMETNFLSVVSLITTFVIHMEETGSGTIAVISSVAGDRGRRSNYVYGTSKAAVSTFLEGVRGRVANSKIKVITIKPGFVDTPMTAHLPKGPLFASPGKVAEGIIRAIDKGKEVAYLPKFWWLIMFIIKHIPGGILKKLNF